MYVPSESYCLFDFRVAWGKNNENNCITVQQGRALRKRSLVTCCWCKRAPLKRMVVRLCVTRAFSHRPSTMALTFRATADVRVVITRSTQLMPKAAEMVSSIWKLVHLKFNIFWWISKSLQITSCGYGEFDTHRANIGKRKTKPIRPNHWCFRSFKV